MRNALTNLFARFHKDEKGVTLVEYGIALMVVIMVGTGALKLLSDEIVANVGDAKTAATITAP